MRAVLFISLGAVVGANARYLVGLWAAQRFGVAFPYGTFVINLTGRFLIALFPAFLAERLVDEPAWRLLLATGFCGSYTTFSTYSYEAVALIREGSYDLAAVYMLGSAALGLAAIVAGALAPRLI